MKKLFLFLILLSQILRAQNKSYQLCDSAIMLMHTGNNVMEGGKYKQGLALWNSINKTYLVNPEKKTYFLDIAWRNKDIESFKETLENLVRDDGFEMNDLEKHHQLYDELKANRVMWDWLNSVYEKNHKLYLSKYADNLWLVQKCRDYVFINEKIIFDVVNAFRWGGANDESQQRKVDSIQQQLSWNVFVDLFEISSQLKHLPNNFDCHHFSVNSNVANVLSANLSNNYKIEEKWLLIRPYLESAFTEGKIAPLSYLYYCDLYSNNAFGYQIYGTITYNRNGEKLTVPIKDEESVNALRAAKGVGPIKISNKK